jgi:hypothetical protein
VGKKLLAAARVKGYFEKGVLKIGSIFEVIEWVSLGSIVQSLAT